jgi:hypothetical protein
MDSVTAEEDEFDVIEKHCELIQVQFELRINREIFLKAVRAMEGR